MLDFVADPWFYAAAVPAVILTGVSKAGFGGAVGSLSVPLMSLAIAAPQAVAIMLPYGQLGLLEPANLGTALLLLPVVPVGYLLGLRILKRVSPAIFIRVASVGLLLTGTKLLWDVTRAS